MSRLPGDELPHTLDIDYVAVYWWPTANWTLVMCDPQEYDWCLRGDRHTGRDDNTIPLLIYPQAWGQLAQPHERAPHLGQYRRRHLAREGANVGVAGVLGTSEDGSGRVRGGQRGGVRASNGPGDCLPALTQIYLSTGISLNSGSTWTSPIDDEIVGDGSAGVTSSPARRQSSLNNIKPEREAMRDTIFTLAAASPLSPVLPAPSDSDAVLDLAMAARRPATAARLWDSSEETRRRMIGNILLLSGGMCKCCGGGGGGGGGGRSSASGREKRRNWAWTIG
ncbi:hypothetical protein GGR56DRAFT_679027 [Xylariaceae sp. FL0804]|nr:hypothetical protein GGR56DRAFT_679027 [Xylariaceae sp. FL0804]